MILPDLLAPGLALVLCGTAPSRASKAAAAYYAHPGNRFWSVLFEVGLVPRRLLPAEYPVLLEYGLGLTDLNKTEWGADSDLSREQFDLAGFVAKMRSVRPKRIAFSSKYAGQTFLGRTKVVAGRQPETLDGIPLIVLPSTSGRARSHFDIGPWRALAEEMAADPCVRPPNPRPDGPDPSGRETA